MLIRNICTILGQYVSINVSISSVEPTLSVLVSDDKLHHVITGEPRHLTIPRLNPHVLETVFASVFPPASFRLSSPNLSVFCYYLSLYPA